MEQDLALLFKKMINNECSPEELSEVLDRLLKNADGNGQELIRKHLAQKINEDKVDGLTRERFARNLQLILADDAAVQKKNTTKRKVITLVRYAVAASILLFAGIGGYLYLKKPVVPVNTAQEVVQQVADFTPGSNKAVLTLSNGKSISLTDAQNGILAKEGKTAIQKKEDGQLTYNVSQNTPDHKIAAITYNTVSIPKGGQYRLTLSDGSKVWLNAASSLKFPTTFTGSYRSVELTGEAYFEVAKNKAKPFHVISNNQTIEVLGTHFNVNSYNDEPAIKTTLLEGKVKVSKGNSTAILKPGQQSVVKLNADVTEIKVNNNVNITEAIAWKNGMFEFTDADIETIMRQIGRWYDVDVVYEGKLPVYHFDGEVPRSANASAVLQILKLSGLNFKIEGGRKIIVKP